MSGCRGPSLAVNAENLVTNVYGILLECSLEVGVEIRWMVYHRIVSQHETFDRLIGLV